MIHEPLIAGESIKDLQLLQKDGDSILETKAITNGILAKHTGKTIEEIDEATSFDNFLTQKRQLNLHLRRDTKHLLSKQVMENIFDVIAMILNGTF